ncbi:MAG: hypothetical protein JXA81_07420, partial [Sedimentisphaerales bacterium]|nr:hypothetical protein [Sedimentisphaerales bacterium]
FRYAERRGAADRSGPLVTQGRGKPTARAARDTGSVFALIPCRLYSCATSVIIRRVENRPAGVAELADARDLKTEFTPL